MDRGALLLDALLQDECSKIAHGSTFLVASFNQHLKRGMWNGDRDPLG